MSDSAHRPEAKLVPNLPHKDWFLPAIESDGSVRNSFDAVLNELKLRAELMVQLRERLTSSEHELDSLSILSREAKELENTLRFRLGILQAERPVAWFRKAPNKDFGPFRTSMLTAPVFSEYGAEDVDAVGSALKRCWEQAQTGPIPFRDPGESLWSILLGHRAQLNSMASLVGPFAGLRLDQPCIDLPSYIESPSLRAFMVNVCGEFVGVKDRLQLCFDHLWSASEKLWAFQRRQVKANSNQHHFRQTSAGRTESTGGQKRQSGSTARALGISYSEMEALRYMGFREHPNDASLKQRYYEMAKQLHPDRQGGNEESFKMLNRAYQILKNCAAR